MIALMMVMVTNFHPTINKNRFYGLFFLFILFSCSNKKAEHNNVNSAPSEKISHVNDSLEITINNIPKEINTGFNYINSYKDAEFISFNNNSKNTKSITKKISKVGFTDYSLRFRSFIVVNNKTVPFYHDYIISQKTNKIDFLFNAKNGDIDLSSSDGDVVDYNFINDAYDKIATQKNFKSINDKIHSIENLFFDFQKKLKSRELLSVNDIIFYKHLSMISSGDKRVEDYLKKINNPVWSYELSELMYYYLQNNKDSIYTFNLTDNETYNNILLLNVFSHLQQFKDNNKKYPNYEKNVAWFKNSNYYKSNKVRLDKLLTGEKVDQDFLKRQLLSFDLHSENKIVKLKDILSSNHANYYLLDFWATWCLPCLDNINMMHKMDLPKGMEIIYISMDKTKDKEKWIKKVQQLHISNSYLFTETKNNKGIIQAIDLNQLPRYILLDKNFNIINSDLITPKETNFLKELKEYMR